MVLFDEFFFCRPGNIFKMMIRSDKQMPAIGVLGIIDIRPYIKKDLKSFPFNDFLTFYYFRIIKKYWEKRLIVLGIIFQFVSIIWILSMAEIFPYNVIRVRNILKKILEKHLRRTKPIIFWIAKKMPKCIWVFRTILIQTNLNKL